LKPVLGTKWKVNTTEAEEIYFYVAGEIAAFEKPENGSFIRPSVGSKLTRVSVKPKQYVTVTIVDEIEMDETGLNLSSEFETMHSRAMGIKSDRIIADAFINATYKPQNVFTNVNLGEYDTADGVLQIAERTAGIGGNRTKYLIVDHYAHAELLKNEKFINDLYGTSGIVANGSLNGVTRLGWKILLLEQLDEEFHGTDSYLPANTCYIVTEESLGAGTHRDGVYSKTEQSILMYNAYIIYSEISLAAVVLSNRAMWKIEYTPTTAVAKKRTTDYTVNGGLEAEILAKLGKGQELGAKPVQGLDKEDIKNLAIEAGVMEAPKPKPKSKSGNKGGDK
jgi:hypothetical protein